MRVVSCETCGGEGECVTPVPASNHWGYVERMGPCPDCNGVGELEVVDPAGPPEVVDLLAEVRRLCR